MPSPEERAKDILESADETLAKLDKAYIFQTKECRSFPSFTEEEIQTGPLLGKGGFSNVFEVSAIMSEEDNDHPTEDGVREDDHYDVDKARGFMSQHCIRHGSSRYAVKRLKPSLKTVDRARGALDLAIEIKFLSAIWHPNIVKMRGLSNTPRVSANTFIIMDRLFGTLEAKIDEWHQVVNMNKGCCGASPKSPEMQALFQERLLVAYDLSTALNYLHGLSLIYRDIKPENIGFDVRGDVKLFDFGLCKSLDHSDKASSSGYKITPKTGSVPYMAPEIALSKPYDRPADVFSFAVLLWELVSLEWAFNGYSSREYFVRVCSNGERLPMDKSWPAVVRNVIREGWDPLPLKRPNMKRMGLLLRGHLEGLTDNEAIRNRSQHMLNRSRRSQHLQSSMLQSRSRRTSYISGDEL